MKADTLKLIGRYLAALVLLVRFTSAQTTFAVTGTAIPAELLQQNYGKLPKGIVGYDLNVCNVSDQKQSIVSGEIFQTLMQTTPGLQPIGREIMLATILRNQNRSRGTILTVALNSAMAVFSVLGSTKYVPSGLITGSALAAISAQQLLTSLRPVLSADQLQTFEAQVLQSALVLDAGSCAERTVFAAAAVSSKIKTLNFHVR